jgi:hypothetical protein
MPSDSERLDAYISVTDEASGVIASKTDKCPILIVKLLVVIT